MLKPPSYSFPEKTTFLLLMLVVLSFASSLLPGQERWIPAMKQNVFASLPSKPLIDTQQPSTMATATFALG